MSGMYNRVEGMGFTIPGLDWVESKTKSLVESIIQKYAEFERIALDTPAAVVDAQNILRVLRDTNAPESQVLEAQRYLQAIQRTQADVANRGPIDQVVGWVRSVTGKQNPSGLGAVPILLPIWIAGTAAVAVYVIGSTMKNWTDAKTIRTALAAGFTPEQIAKIGVGSSPFKLALFGGTSAVTLGVLAFGAYFVWRALKPGR